MKICTTCKQPADTRPYGFNSAEVCFPCAMSTPEGEAEAKRQFTALLDACGPTAVLTENGPVPLVKDNLH